MLPSNQSATADRTDKNRDSDMKMAGRENGASARNGDLRRFADDLESRPRAVRISEPLAPHLQAPVAPFAGKSPRKIAATAAKYYGECTIQGINPKEADDAARESQSHFQNWWLQSRFKIKEEYLGVTSGSEDENGGAKTSGTTSAAVAAAAEIRKKRPRATDDMSIDRESKRLDGSSDDDKNRPGDAINERSSDDVMDCDNFVASHKQVFSFTKRRLKKCKAKLLKALSAVDGDTTCSRVREAVDELQEVYKSTGTDARKEQQEQCLDGVWLTMSKPNYPECLGTNEAGEYMYTLGRMSFDMFRPTSLKCSIQGVFNPVFATDVIPEDVPRSLRKEVQERQSVLRTYNIVTAFTIVAEDSKAPPVKGVMTTYSYMLPDPDEPNRLTVFFTGGLLEPNDETDKDQWNGVFGSDAPKRYVTERVRVLAAKVLLGAAVPDKLEDDGSMSFYLKRPIGGHGRTFVDVLYLDDTLRVMRGQTGSLYVFSRVQQPQG